MRRRWFLLLPAIALLGLAPALARLNEQPLTRAPEPEPAPAFETVPESAAPAVVEQAQQQVDASRRTAIVRAAERVAPAVVSDLLREERVRRAWVGVEVVPHEPNRWGRSRQVRVARVAPGSPAAAAGLQPGMVVTAVGSRPVASPLDGEARLLDARVGETVEVHVQHDGRARTLRVGTDDLPSLTAERVSALDEFELITLTPAVRAERRVANEQGALIVKLPPAALQVGLREGDLIVQINRTPVRTAEEAASLLRRLGGTRTPVRVIIERQGQLISTSFTIT